MKAEINETQMKTSSISIDNEVVPEFFLHFIINEHSFQFLIYMRILKLWCFEMGE